MRPRTAGVGIVVVLHDLNLAQRYADDVLLMNPGGALLHGPTADVLHGASIQAVWGTIGQQVRAHDGAVQHLFG